MHMKETKIPPLNIRKPSSNSTLKQTKKYTGYLPNEDRIPCNPCIQRYCGAEDSAIKCDTRIYYTYNHRDNGRIINDTDDGQGGSDSTTARSVLDKFRYFSLDALADVEQATDGNPPGQCAEPHAVADALDTIKQNNDIRRNTIQINRIRMYDAVIANPSQSMINQGRRRGEIMPRCTTCAQWVPGNEVLPQYIPADTILF